MRRPRLHTVYQKLAAITLTLSLALVVWLLAFQGYFVGRVRRIYESNMDFVIGEVVQDLRSAFSSQGDAVEQIAGNVDVKEYAATDEVTARYRKAYESVRPIVQMAVSGRNIGHVIVFDETMTWYQFVGGLSMSACRTLRAAYAELHAPDTRVMELDGHLYLCAAEPVTQLVGARIEQVGLVIALSDLARFQPMLAGFAQLQAGTILVHDGTTVLLSNAMSLAGAPLADIPMDPRHYYAQEAQVLPGLLRVTILLSRAQVFPQQAAFAWLLLAAGLFSLLVLLMGSFIVNRWLARPYGHILREMNALGVDDQEGRLTQTGVSHMDSLVDNINGMLGRLEESGRRAFDAQQTLYREELRRQRIETYLLKKQIDAHFLNNALISIKSLYDQGRGESAGEVLQGVAALLHYAHGTNEIVPIFDEMSIIQRYAQIMNIRFGGKFAVSYDVDDRLTDYAMPKMLLQPLVENALVHGLAARGEGCRVEIHGRLEPDAVVLSVWDNGEGIGGEALAALRARLSHDADDYEYLHIIGVSLVNIQRRITTAFGPGYGLTVESAKGEYTRATVRIARVEAEAACSR